MKEPIEKRELKAIGGGNGKIAFDPKNPQEVEAVSQALEELKKIEDPENQRLVIQKLLVALETYRH